MKETKGTPSKNFFKVFNIECLSDIMMAHSSLEFRVPGLYGARICLTECLNKHSGKLSYNYQNVLSLCYFQAFFVPLNTIVN